MLGPAHSKEAAASYLITGINNSLIIGIAFLHFICIIICNKGITFCKETILAAVKLHTKYIHITTNRKINLTIKTSFLFCRNCLEQSFCTCNQIVGSSKHFAAFTKVFGCISIRLNAFGTTHICNLSSLNKNICNLCFLFIIKIIELCSSPALCIFSCSKIRITVSIVVVSKI